MAQIICFQSHFIDALLNDLPRSLSSLPFASAVHSAATAHLQQVANNGIDVITKDAVSLNHLQIAETHRQHHLHAAAKNSIR